MRPKVSVLMSTLNAERYLAQCIESMLGQTFSDFQFIIVDDGSTDASLSLIDKYAKVDSRIDVIRSVSRGLTHNLNVAARAADGVYLARMDADDVSYPLRLERQVSFLDNNPDVSAVGTWINSIDANGNTLGHWHPPTEPADLLWRMMFENVVAHPSAMIRTECLKSVGYYDERRIVAQDYDLWTRIALLGGRISNLPEVLLDRRIHAGQVSASRRQEQLSTSQSIAGNYVYMMLADHISHDEALAVAHVLRREVGLVPPKLALTIGQNIHRVCLELTDRLGRPSSARLRSLLMRRLNHAGKHLALNGHFEAGFRCLLASIRISLIQRP